MLDNMNGGAVREDRSPEKLAIDFRNALQLPRFCAETPAPSFSLEDMSRVVAMRRLLRLHSGSSSGEIVMVPAFLIVAAAMIIDVC